MIFTEFNSTTGRFGGFHFCNPPDLEYARTQIFNPEYDDVMHGSFDASEKYLQDGVVCDRPASPITLTGLTLNNIPANSKLHIEGSVYTVTGSVDLDFPLPGTYKIFIDSFPYKDWDGEITV